MAERTADVPTLEDDFPGPAYVRSVATLNRNLGAQSVMPGNRIDLFPVYAESVAAMTAEIDKASMWVHVEFYITAWDDVTGPFYDALVRAVDRGVTVRLLFDHLGPRASPATSSSPPGWTRPASSGARCCRSRRSSAGPTCATTARSW